QLDERVCAGRVAADEDVEIRVGHHRDVNGVGEIGNVAFAGSEDRLPGVRVRCAAHFEGESRIIVWIAVDAIRAINRDAWYLDAALAENDGIGGDVGAAWYRPLFTIRHPAAARDHKFNRAAARSDGLSSDIDQAVRGGRIIGS